MATRPPVGLWLQNARHQSQPKPFSFQANELDAVENIQGLTKAINSALQLKENSKSASCLKLIQDDTTVKKVVIVKKLTSLNIISNADLEESWTILNATGIGKNFEYPILIADSEIVNSHFEEYSVIAEKIFKTENFFETRKTLGSCGRTSGTNGPASALSLRDYLGVPNPVKCRNQESAGALTTGLRRHPQSKANTESQSGNLRSASTAGEIFPKFIFASDLGIDDTYPDSSTQVRAGSAISVAQNRLYEFLLARENGLDLRYSVQDQKDVVIHEGNPHVLAYRKIRIHCSGKSPQSKLSKGHCEYGCTYEYITDKTSSGIEGRSPIFKLIKSTTTHNCTEQCWLYSGRGSRGHSSWTLEDLRQIKGLMRAGVKLDKIVLAAGFQGSNGEPNPMRKKQLYDAIQHQSSKIQKDVYQNLMTSLKERLECGDTAFVSMQGLDGSKDAKPRFYVQLVDHLAILKLGWVPVFSIDFMYRILRELNVAFGHVSVLTPAHLLVIVAIFFIETENQDGIDWILKKFLWVHEHFKIKLQSMVCTLLTSSLRS